MKKLFILLFLILPTFIWAQSGTKDGAFNASGVDQLYILVDTGMKINVTGSDTDQISYDYEFEGNSEAYDHYFKNFEPEFETRGGQASFKIDFPSIKRKKVNFRTKKHILTLNVPKALELELQTRYSKVDIKSIDRTTSVRNRSGSVVIQDIGQGISVVNEYGNVQAANINGDVNITSRSARIDVKDVKGSLTVRSNYTKMNLTKISGELDLENRSGTVNAYNLDSKITSRGDYTNYELTDIRSDVDIDTKSGTVLIDRAENVNITGDYTNVTASDIKGDRGISVSTKSSKVSINNVLSDVRINGEYINMKLENISGAADLRNKSGKIDASGVKGALYVDGEYNKLNIKDYLGDYVAISNRSGDINLDATEQLKYLEIIASYTDIDIHLDKSYTGTVKFDLEYGKLTQPFKLNNASMNESRNSTRIQGEVGSGNGKMVIQSRNGDITITQ